MFSYLFWFMCTHRWNQTREREARIKKFASQFWLSFYIFCRSRYRLSAKRSWRKRADGEMCVEGAMCWLNCEKSRFSYFSLPPRWWTRGKCFRVNDKNFNATIASLPLKRQIKSCCCCCCCAISRTRRERRRCDSNQFRWFRWEAATWDETCAAFLSKRNQNRMCWTVRRWSECISWRSQRVKLLPSQCPWTSNNKQWVDS